jgi:carboxyl-terminal processing protease
MVGLQLEGVSSDIVMPDRYTYFKMGNDIDNAMPWDKIDPTDYTIWNNNSNFNQATNSKNRISINPNFQFN